MWFSKSEYEGYLVFCKMWLLFTLVSNLELRYHADNDQDFVLMFDRVAVDAAEGDSGLKRHGKTG